MQRSSATSWPTCCWGRAPTRSSPRRSYRSSKFSCAYTRNRVTLGGVRSVVALPLCGCGRLGFEAGNVADAPTDAAIDAPSFCALNAQAMFCSDLSSMGQWTVGNMVNASHELVDGELHV